ncbi:DUF5685 family protein [Lachnobacterium bovis]|uniref:Uncharacterized protein n=1 Tax=Lachnobacterium bovis TaxID=140626 RepID=A0A1H9PDF1_9FIRM|nr:DUF5685 family protein [Lachnobacterium bovis]SER46256.1 hypothetical protein SAMN02910429_00209 [Lachnobacterium bovis]
MFGYINVNTCNLSEKEKNLYEAYYYGIVKELRSRIGIRQRIVFRSDMAFLNILLEGIYGTRTKKEKYNLLRFAPFKIVSKKVVYRGKITEYVAEMNIVLAYHNYLDDWRDERCICKKLFCDCLKKEYLKIVKKYPRQIKVIEKNLMQLSIYEKNGEDNIELVSQTVGEMVGEIFAWKEDQYYEELKMLGFYIGKLIYILDAYVDFEYDMKKKLYNPLTKIREDAGSKEDFESMCKIFMESLKQECSKIYVKLPIFMHNEIIENVLYSGIMYDLG